MRGSAATPMSPLTAGGTSPMPRHDAERSLAGQGCDDEGDS